jgi:hypothetical protein
MPSLAARRVTGAEPNNGGPKSDRTLGLPGWTDVGDHTAGVKNGQHGVEPSLQNDRARLQTWKNGVTHWHAVVCGVDEHEFAAWFKRRCFQVTLRTLSGLPSG